jgi:hypothetical protein
VNDALAQLASTGVVGVCLVIALIALWQKDKDLRTTESARIEDAQRMLTLAMTLQKDSTLAITALTAVMEELKEQRELLTREMIARNPQAVRR